MTQESIDKYFPKKVEVLDGVIERERRHSLISDPAELIRERFPEVKSQLFRPKDVQEQQTHQETLDEVTKYKPDSI